MHMLFPKNLQSLQCKPSITVSTACCWCASLTVIGAVSAVRRPPSAHVLAVCTKSTCHKY